MALLKMIKSTFSGKLGGWVGTEYYNDPIIRAYTVPHDPKTEQQLDIRKHFTDATKLLAPMVMAVGRNTPLYNPKKQLLQTILHNDKVLILREMLVVPVVQFSKGKLSCWNITEKARTNTGITYTLGDKAQRVDMPNMKLCVIIATTDNKYFAFGMQDVDKMQQGAELETVGYDFTNENRYYQIQWTIAKRDGYTYGSDTMTGNRWLVLD